MNTTDTTHHIHQDPLGLQNLPLLTPETDGWIAVRQALQEQQRRKRQWRTASAWLAIAASMVLAVLVTTRQTGPLETGSPPAATQAAKMASVDSSQAVDSLISLSQTLESQLRSLREGTGSMPASSAVYVAELEDLVAQVDSELSYSPDSLNLWGQRVNLLLDLAQIYQHQWETDYGQMASL
jgi:hypothetical protein